MYIYGCFLEQGKYVNVDKEESIQYFIKSANEGNIEAIRHYNKILDEEQNYKYEEDYHSHERIIERRRSFSSIGKEKSSLFVKLDESCRGSFIDGEFGDSLFYVAASLIEGKNNFPKNTAIGIEYLERSILKKNVDVIRFYFKNILDEKSYHYHLLNEISSIHDSSKIKVDLSKQILSSEIFDIVTPTNSQNINYKLVKKMSKESSDMGNLRVMIIYSQLCLKNKKNRVCEIKSNFK